MEVNSQELIYILKDKITLYEHLGIDVVMMRSHEVRFNVSLEKNLNHKGTAFGGSQYAVAVLAAYALVLAGLRERNIQTENIVIAKGEIDYLRPVASDFEVICKFATLAEENSFYETLVQTGRVRSVIQSQIVAEGGSLKSILRGDFVVKL